MSEQSARLNLPFIQPAQAQKHVTHNESLEILDTVVQLRLEAINTNDPASNPNEGDAWFVGSNPTGAWIGSEDLIATWQNNGWLFIAPVDGWMAWNADTQSFVVWQSGAWSPLAADANLQNVSGLGINAASDATNPLTVSGAGSLFNHAGTDHRLTINKATPTDTNSVVFQTGFSGRTEIGCVGTDSLSIRTSADGTTWADRLSIDQDRVSISDLVSLSPSTQPASPAQGDLYFDSASSKLRCFDGSVWHDLY